MQNHVREKKGDILKGIRPFFHQVSCIKPLVWKGEYADGTSVILKGATKMEYLWKQIQLAHYCSSSFVSFVPFVDRKWIKESNGIYWACMEFVEGRALDYSLKEDRQLALEKIAHFQQEAVGFKSNALSLLSLKRKWTNRWIRFTQDIEQTVFSSDHHELIQRYVAVGKSVLSEMTGLDDLEEKAFQNNIIVHGDPAQHNFIFHIDGLLLIDGDLVAYAPHEYDYLQLLTRMLPYCSWSLDEWSDYPIPALENCITNPSLRRLLAYPADFYRDWLLEPGGREQLLLRTERQDRLRYGFMCKVLK